MNLTNEMAAVIKAALWLEDVSRDKQRGGGYVTNNFNDGLLSNDIEGKVDDACDKLFLAIARLPAAQRVAIAGNRVPGYVPAVRGNIDKVPDIRGQPLNIRTPKKKARRK